MNEKVTHIDVSPRLVLHQLARYVLAGGAGTGRHLAVILPVPAWRMGEQGCRGGMSYPRVRHQSSGLPCQPITAMSQDFLLYL